MTAADTLLGPAGTTSEPESDCIIDCSVPEQAAALLEFVFVDLAAREAFFKDISRGATRGWIVQGGSSLPRPAEPSDRDDNGRDHDGENQDHE
jgi:hypothetical protein